MTSGLFDLTGKVVLATGSNSGIGLGFLQGCAKHGADVVVWGRRADKNADAVAALKALGAPRARRGRGCLRRGRSGRTGGFPRVGSFEFHTGDILVVDGGRTVKAL